MTEPTPEQLVHMVHEPLLVQFGWDANDQPEFEQVCGTCPTHPPYPCRYAQAAV
jgi:hypothetical protein